MPRWYYPSPSLTHWRISSSKGNGYYPFPLLDGILQRVNDGDKQEVAEAARVAEENASGGNSETQSECTNARGPARLGTCANVKRPRVQFNRVGGGYMAGTEGQAEDTFGPDKDNFDSNHKVGMFIRACPQAVMSHVEVHGRVRVTTQVEGHKLEDVIDFAERLEGEGPTFDAWRKMGEFLSANRPDDSPNRDTSKDINILPASPVLVGFAAKVMVNTTRPSR